MNKFETPWLVVWYYTYFLLSSSGLSQYSFNETLLEKKIKVLCLQGRIEDAYSEALIWLQREPRVSLYIDYMTIYNIAIN